MRVLASRARSPLDWLVGASSSAAQPLVNGKRWLVLFTDNSMLGPVPGEVHVEGCNSADTDRTHLLPHLQWKLQEMMSRVRPADLSVAEISALLDILAPAHCRVIGGPDSRPRLRLLGDCGDQPAPKLVYRESIEPPLKSPVNIVRTPAPISSPDG